MNYIKNKKNTIYLLLIMAGLLSLVIGTSYAILKGTTNDTNEQIIKTGSVKLKLTESFDDINKKVTIMGDEEGLLQEKSYDFNIKNIGSSPTKYDLKLINEVPSTYTGKVLDTKYIKAGLEINGEEYGPMSLEKVKNIIDSDVIYANEIINYKLRIWLDKSKEDEISKLEDYKAFLKLKIDAEQRPESMETKDGVKTFNYTGDVQEYTVPRDGYYYIEMAGASGGLNDTRLGLGAKTSGYIELKAGEKLYFYVGKQGTEPNTNCRTSDYEFNGGGIAVQSQVSGKCGATGGGATDVRLVSGSWDNTSSLISRIMVAGAGGGTGGNGQMTSGDGGTLYGEKPIFATYQTYQGNPGTQISGGAAPTKHTSATSNGTAGSFGKGGYGGGNGNMGSTDKGGGGGGGSGYYGGSGASGLSNGTWAGGGGSSYISGYAGVNSVKESTTITHTNQTIHYSGKYFIGAEMIEGQNTGNGYAKISFVDTKPKRRNTSLNNVRYIKDCTSYNTANNENNWVEIQAIKNGVNIAKGKTVTGTGTESSTKPYSRITDGDITYSNWANAGTMATNQCVTIDLGQTYDLDEVALWNYFGDQRRYISNNFQVSSDNSTWTNLSENEAWYETSNGARYNAYIHHINGYTRNGLQLWYDGYSNTGSTRNTTTTTWKNLASSSYSGTVSGATWYSDYLSFDGSNDWVKIAAMNFATPTIEVVFNKTGTTGKTEEVLVGNFESGGYGLTYISNQLAGEAYINSAYRLLYKPMTLNKKEVLAVSYDKSDLNLYSDGKKYSNQNISGTIGNPTNSTIMAIATNPAGSSPASNTYFKGNIHSVRIYNKALTEEEIEHNYQYDKQKFNLD